MRNWKRAAAILLMAAMTLGALAACNKNSGSNENDTDPKTIQVGSSFSYYPFGYMDGTEKVGFEVDVWKEIGQRSGLKVEHVQAAYSGLFGLVDKGDIDTVANQVSKNPEREEKYNFSVPYCYNPLKLIVPKDNPENIQELADCVGKKVTCGIGGNEVDIVKEKYPNGEVELVPVETGNLLQVTMGKTSACIQGAAAASVEIKDNELPLTIVGDAIYLEEDAYLFAKTPRGDALRAKVDAALKEMHEDGTLTKLAEQWFGYDISKKN